MRLKPFIIKPSEPAYCNVSCQNQYWNSIFEIKNWVISTDITQKVLYKSSIEPVWTIEKFETSYTSQKSMQYAFKLNPGTVNQILITDYEGRGRAFGVRKGFILGRVNARRPHAGALWVRAWCVRTLTLQSELVNCWGSVSLTGLVVVWLWFVIVRYENACSVIWFYVIMRVVWRGVVWKSLSSSSKSNL